MPTYGGFSPQPERYGGGVPRGQRILESLNAAMGTAYDTSRGTTVYAENLATARCINAAWENNQRLANQWDPRRMTVFVPRWERILKLTPLPTDTMPVRRRRIAAVFARWSQLPTYQQIKDKLSDALATTFVDLEHIAPADAVTWWPGGTPNADFPWYSTISHLLIRVTKPTPMTEATFYSTMGLILPLLDGFVPAWVTWSWIRNGPNGDGFFLDELHNLDNESFA